MEATMLRTLGVLLLGALLLLGAAHLACKDHLLFQSDAWSLTVYFGAMGLASLPVLAVLALATGLGRRLAPKLFRVFHAIFVLTATTAVVAVFVVLVTRAVGGSVQRFFSSPAAFCTAVGLVTILALFQLQSLIDRVERLSLVLLGAVVLGIPAMIAWNHFAPRGPSSAGDTPKHLVVIVMDKFPAQLIHAYNPDIAPSLWDDFLRQGRVLREMRTAAPYTHRFFGALYTGKWAPKMRDAASPISKGNLLSTLQAEGVNAQWIVSYQNALPEGSEAQTADYRGLRSFLLSENHSWLPRLLGLDYHAYLDPRLPYDNIFTECLLPQFQERAAGHRNTFTLCHFNWERGRRRRHERQSPGFGILVDMARAGGYSPSEESLVSELRQRDAREIVSVADCLSEFLAAVRQDESLRNTTILVTADHGFMYGKGRLAYGHHPNQDTIKVLCAAFGPDETPRVDERFFSTPDLTAGILDYFHIAFPTESGAQSIFGSGPGRDRVTSITAKNDQANEWWLVVVDKKTKHCFNLHPQGSGQAVAYATNSFDSVEVPLIEEGYRSEGPPRQNIPAIREALARSGVAPTTIDAVDAALREEWLTVGVGRDLAPVFREAAARFGIQPGDVHPAYVQALTPAEASTTPQTAKPLQDDATEPPLTATRVPILR
jgi:hypothetical protein